ncbi:MAG: hypothetical protein HND58_18375 [Planctomycetota bacterium]|nr:MAG: hypothetical protein HND58_18375 [Planctomycetota bacterium]
MAQVTYDGRSFMLDGRRVWIVGGSVHYARLPRSEWAGRIAAAKQAGLNAIETPAVWSRHEPRPGKFDFEGDNDLRHFVQLAGEAGLHVILRTGPFVGSGYDAGGLPAWLLAKEGVEPRRGNGPFLEACSRYLTALVGQVKDLQVDSPGKGGPILLVQNEHGWSCGDDVQAAAYLGELLRYLREAGVTVPVINANGLWQSVEGEIECWSGAEDLLSITRQLSEVHPRAPRLIADLRLGDPMVWGQDEPEPLNADAAVRSAAEALAGAAQFVLNPFAGGQTFGFGGGRMPHSMDGYITTRHDHGRAGQGRRRAHARLQRGPAAHHVRQPLRSGARAPGARRPPRGARALDERRRDGRAHPRHAGLGGVPLRAEGQAGQGGPGLDAAAARRHLAGRAHRHVRHVVVRVRRPARWSGHARLLLAVCVRDGGQHAGLLRAERLGRAGEHQRLAAGGHRARRQDAGHHRARGRAGRRRQRRTTRRGTDL